MNNEKEISNKTKAILIVIFLIIDILGLWLLTKCHDGDNSSSNTLYIHSYIYSQTLVKEKLKSPKSAKFPSYSDSFITDKGDKIVVSAYVDASNSFGVSVRTYYTATINIKNNEPQSGTVDIK